MKSFISEDNNEQAICNRLSQPEFCWTRIECDPSLEKQDDVSVTGRSSVEYLKSIDILDKIAKEEMNKII